jgi:hypothetical protein
MARARGYGEELARVAANVIAKAPPCSRFHIAREVIVIAMGEGLEVRIHRAPQSWVLVSEEEG